MAIPEKWAGLEAAAATAAKRRTRFCQAHKSLKLQQSRLKVAPLVIQHFDRATAPILTHWSCRCKLPMTIMAPKMHCFSPLPDSPVPGMACSS